MEFQYSINRSFFEITSRSTEKGALILLNEKLYICFYKCGIIHNNGLNITWHPPETYILSMNGPSLKRKLNELKDNVLQFGIPYLVALLISTSTQKFRLSVRWLLWCIRWCIFASLKK